MNIVSALRITTTSSFAQLISRREQGDSPNMSGYRTRFLMLSVILILAASSSVWASDLPDPAITPGAIDPSISQANIQSTVCIRGYTKTVRPPAHYTNKLKKRQIRE